MPDSQSSEPGFESPFATVSKIGHFHSLHWRPSWLSCINEYLAIDSGGNVSDLVLAHNCCLTRTLPWEAELVSEWTGLPGKAKSVKRFERANGLDTALYKNYFFLRCQHMCVGETDWTLATSDKVRIIVEIMIMSSVRTMWKCYPRRKAGLSVMSIKPSYPFPSDMITKRYTKFT